MNTSILPSRFFSREFIIELKYNLWAITSSRKTGLSTTAHRINALFARLVRLHRPIIPYQWNPS